MLMRRPKLLTIGFGIVNFMRTGIGGSLPKVAVLVYQSVRSAGLKRVPWFALQYSSEGVSVNDESGGDFFLDPPRQLSKDEAGPVEAVLPEEPTAPATQTGSDDRREATLILPSGPFRPETAPGPESTVDEFAFVAPEFIQPVEGDQGDTDYPKC
jgi:hypothetical protein